jgi:hypothetical protein
MIEESLLKSNFLGKDGFVWWIGQVADPSVWLNEKSRVDEPKDTSWAYRCKVRIVGSHTFDINELPDKDLPWAHVLTSAADGAPGHGGFGKLSMLVGGETVLGFFLDGEEGQQPVVMSCFYRNKATENAKEPGPFKPFTGQKGNRANSSTRSKQQEPGTTQQPPAATNSGGPAVTISGNPGFGNTNPNSLNAASNFTSSSTNNTNTAGASFGTVSFPKDELFYNDLASLAFSSNFDPVKSSNGCGNNVISEITAALQNFIKEVNKYEKTALGFIDPIRNKVVDIQQKVRSVSQIIASLVKWIINAMRDQIVKYVGKAFTGIVATLPKPQQLPVSEAGKAILDKIFCIFDNLK